MIIITGIIEIIIWKKSTNNNNNQNNKINNSNKNNIDTSHNITDDINCKKKYW